VPCPPLLTSNGASVIEQPKIYPLPAVIRSLGNTIAIAIASGN
jgi:hypothetical protein